MELKNKVVLITGANRGIGLALANEMSLNGANLILLNRSVDNSLNDQLKDRGALSVEQIQIDLANENAIKEFIKNWGERPLDILIHNAGVLTGGPLESQTTEEIRNLFAVNVLSVIQLTQGLLPNLIKNKNSMIVLNASVSAVMYFPYANTYAASKAALRALGYSLNAELSGSGVRVLNLFTPGIQTRMFEQISGKYSEHMDVSYLTSISAEKYAQKVIEAIELEKEELNPSGITYMLFLLARISPFLFSKLAKKVIKHRNSQV